MNASHQGRRAISRLAGLTAVAASAALVALAGPAFALTTGFNGERTVELVSSAPKDVSVTAGDISRDGKRVLYRVQGGTDQTGYGVTGTLLAERTPSGWQSANPFPPRSVLNSGDASVLNASPDLNVLTIQAGAGFGSIGPSTVVRYDRLTGEVSRGPVIPTDSTSQLDQNVASDDQRHVVTFLTVSPMVPGVYEVAGPELHDIGLMPDGTLPSCGVSHGGFAASYDTLARDHRISVDGRRVFFGSRGNDCAGAQNLYMRQGGIQGDTTLISGPVLTGPERDTKFVRATPDGSKVFFTTESVLDPSDGNSTTDVYRYSVGEGNTCITCGVPEANVQWESQRNRVAVAENGERVYFVSAEALSAGATPGRANLYVWRASSPSQIDYVSPIGKLGVSGTELTSWVSVDGSVLIFWSNRREMDDFTDSRNGGFFQYYKYDDRTRSVRCVSCPLGEPSRSVTEFPATTGIYTIDHKEPLTPDGRSFFFTTSDPLVETDVNSTADIYEWRGDAVALITDGRSPNPDLFLFGASADGSDVIFSVKEMLTPDADERSGQLYDARVGRGFAEPYVAPRCAGDACQGRPSAPPAWLTPVAARGGGDAPVSPRATFSVRALTPAQRAALEAGRSVAVTVRVNRSGRVRASLGRHGGVVASVLARGSGPVRLRLRLNGKARATLAREGRLTATLTVSFTGAPEPVTRKLSLRRPK